MKKILMLISLIFLVTACEKAKVDDTKNIDINYDVYYYMVNYVTPSITTNISKINTKTMEDKLLLNTDLGISMIQYEDENLYGIFNNRIGYIKDNQIYYVTTTDEYVARYFVKGSIIYFGKDNNNASDDIFESFSMTDIYNNQKNINENGISNLAVGDYIYFKPNSGADVNNLLQYKLDGTDKKTLYTGNFGLVTLSEQYIYFINYNDNNSLYRMKKDSNEATKIANGPFTFETYNVNAINGVYKLATIGDTLYYINSQDGYKLYKYDGKNKKVTEDSIKAVKAFDNKLFVIYKNRTGLFALNLDGALIKQILNMNPNEYDID